jgi:hypothetical protein
MDSNKNKDKNKSKKHVLQYVAPAPITLEEEDPQAASACWATDVRVGECTIVTGDKGQRFACWTIVVTMASGSVVSLRKRYSELDALAQQLARELGSTAASGSGSGRGTEMIPSLPPKRVLQNLESKFLAKRRAGIEWFLSCVLLDPALANTRAVRAFVVPSASAPSS